MKIKENREGQKDTQKPKPTTKQASKIILTKNPKRKINTISNVQEQPHNY